jgi:cytochrome P450
MQWIGGPTDYLHTTAGRYGDPFTMRVGVFPPLVMFSDPQAIQQLFTAEAGSFDAGASNVALRPTLGVNSLLLLDGERHQQQRRLLTPPFHGERMRAYGTLIRRVTEEVMARWQPGKPFSVRSAMQRISLRVILQAVFGLHDGARLVRLRQALGDMLDAMSSPLNMALLLMLPEDWGPWSPRARLQTHLGAIDALLYAEIRARRERFDPAAGDILSLLLAARDEAGQSMSDIELRDELMTLLVAGHETTATAMAWAFYWIHYLPAVRERLLAELDSLDSDPDSEAIARLPYLGAVCSETLRIYPVALIASPRVARQRVRIVGRDYEAGARLAANIYLAHHRPETYPDPECFRPERFLERTFSLYEFLPFGGGTRRCIGMAFALYEMKLVLATVLLQRDLNLVQPRLLKPVRRGVTLAPPAGLFLVATGERSASRLLSRTPSAGQ